MKRLLLFLCLSFFFLSATAQTTSSLNRFNYQAFLGDSSGAPIPTGSLVSCRVSIIEMSSTVLFQELHSITTNQNGIFRILVGGGISTGLGSFNDIESIRNSSSSLVLKIELDLGSGFIPFQEKPIFSVPVSSVSLYSKESLSLMYLPDLSSNTLQNDHTFHFIGTSWVTGADILSADTVGYSLSAAASSFSDTTGFAPVSIQMNSDTATFTFLSNNAAAAGSAVNAAFADSGSFSLLSQNTDSVKYGWHLRGNPSLPASSFIGTKDAASLSIITSDLERIRVTSQGTIIGGSSGSASFSVSGLHGIVYNLTSTGKPWSSPTAGTSALMFTSDSVSFAAGTSSLGQWSSSNRGKLSFAFGRDIISKGKSGSIVIGDSCESSPFGPVPNTNTDGTNSFAFGKGSRSHGRFSVAIGYQSKTYMMRGVAMGHKSVSQRSSAASAFGYEALASGSTSVAIGYRVKATGDKSYAMGSMASTNNFTGSFIYGDASSTDTVKCTGINQFVVRAAGGTTFFTDSALTVGARLFAGSGSWSIVSDSSKKENFIPVNDGSLAAKISSVNVYTWNYISSPGKSRHIGPMSQSFYKTGFGESDRAISAVDADGTVLSLIRYENKKLNEITGRLNSASATLKEIDKNDLDFSELSRRLEALEKRSSKTYSK